MNDMEELANHIMLQVNRQISMIAQARFATVTSYDPSTHSAKFTLEPDGNPTGWLPIRTHGASKNGISEQVGPSIGDQAFLHYAEGDPESGVCLGFTHNDVDQPPGAQSGQAIVQHNPTGVQRLLSSLGHFIKAPKLASSVISQTITHFAQDAIGNATANISHTADNNISHTANKGGITHAATLGSIVHMAGANILHQALDAITHIAQQGGITHTAQQGNITHTAQQGSISHTAQGNISHTSSGGSITQSAPSGTINQSATTMNMSADTLNIG